MKKILILLTLILVCSCTINKKPTFLRLGEVKLVGISADSVKVQTSAFFKNDNDVGGKISTDNIEVFVEDKSVAKVKSEEFKVPANKEFEIPLDVAIPYNKMFDKGLLGGLLNTVLNNNKVKLRFKGDINYKVLGFSSSYTVDKVKVLKLK